MQFKIINIESSKQVTGSDHSIVMAAAGDQSCYTFEYRIIAAVLWHDSKHDNRAMADVRSQLADRFAGAPPDGRVIKKLSAQMLKIRREGFTSACEIGEIISTVFLQVKKISEKIQDLNKLEINEIRFETVLKIFDYLYSDSIIININELGDIIRLAKRFQTFKQIQFKYLKQVIKSKDVVVEDEKRIFEIIVQWIKVDIQRRQQIGQQLLEDVRFPLMPLEYLHQISALEIIQNNIILIGGWGTSQLCTEYDPKNKTFTELEPLPDKGGTDMRNKICLTSMERFDVEIEQWSILKSSIGVGRRALTLTVFKNQIILIGGSDKEYKKYKTIQKYDSISDSQQFSVNPRLNKIKICGIRFEIVNKLLEYFYTDSIIINQNELKEIIQLAKIFQLDRVLEIAFNYIKDNLNIENALGIRDLCLSFDQLEIVENCDKFVLNHFEDVSKSQTFKQIKFKYLEQLIKSDDLVVKANEKLICIGGIDDQANVRKSIEICSDFGNNIILIGGKGTSRLCTKYDPKNKTFTELETLPDKRYNIIINLKFLNRKEISKYEVSTQKQSLISLNLDEINGKWRNRKSSSEARDGSTGCSVNDKFYVFGGIMSNSCEYYCPQDDSWRSLPKMKEERWFAGSCYDNNKFIYVVGGWDERNDIISRQWKDSMLKLNNGQLLNLPLVLDLDRILEIAFKNIKENLNFENVLSIRDLYLSIGHMDKVENCDKFVVNNFDQISKAQTFKQIQFKYLKQVIQSKDVVVEDEKRIFEIIVQWIKVDIQRRQQIGQQLLEDVRFPLMPVEYLHQISSDEIIESRKVCNKIFESIYYSHEKKFRNGQNILKSADVIPRKYTNSCANERLICIGGNNDKGNKVISIEICSDIGSTWNQFDEINTGRSYFACCTYKNNIILIGGIETYTLCTKYDPKNKTFTELEPLPDKREDHVATIINTELLVLGGLYTRQSLISLNLDEENGKWRNRKSSLESRWGSTGCSVNVRTLIDLN
ncbi:Kelch-like protein 1 [Nymphon striatum]|nr:Kelch-like protein 1 [Nymphon striatum]